MGSGAMPSQMTTAAERVAVTPAMRTPGIARRTGSSSGRAYSASVKRR